MDITIKYGWYDLVMVPFLFIGFTLKKITPPLGSGEEKLQKKNEQKLQPMTKRRRGRGRAKKTERKRKRLI
jgi:hypothetical protein